jgi:predicted ArsR family transcriptional regulator
MEFCTEHWANHRRGQGKRQLILEILQKNPQATVAELAIACELSPWQIRRHLARLRQDGKISA